MIRGFVYASLCVLLGLAALFLWGSDPQAILVTLAPMQGPDTYPRSGISAAGTLYFARTVIPVCFALALSLGAWLVRPTSWRVAIGALAGALVAATLVVASFAASRKIAEFEFKALAPTHSIERAPEPKP